MKNGSPLVVDLALCSQQFCGVVKHAQLAPVDETILKDFKHPASDETELVSIAAGELSSSSLLDNDRNL